MAAFSSAADLAARAWPPVIALPLPTTACHARNMSAEKRARLLVDFYFAHPVGHVIEALRYGLGYHRADPDLRVGLVLNGSSPTELAELVPQVEAVYAVGGCLDFVDGGDARRAIAHIPREWDWVVDDARRDHPGLRAAFAGMVAYYDAADRHFLAARGRGVAGAEPPAYVPHQQVVLDLPEASRARARQRLGGTWPRIAVMPGGSGARALYPSAASWERILHALAGQYPDAVFCLVGKLGSGDGRTSTQLSRAEVDRLLGAVERGVDAFDLPLFDQLALVEACEVFVAPHTGFGMAALAVGTPWLTLSGNRWPEYFYNNVPFYSVLPDPTRFPCFHQLEPEPPLVADRDGEGPRSPSMCADRIDDDLDDLVQAAGLLIERRLSYEQAMAGHFERLQRFFHGRTPLIWSIDNAHADYVDPSAFHRAR
jgi:hypothetical protein